MANNIVITGPEHCVVCRDRANHIAPGGDWYCDIHYLPILQRIVDLQTRDKESELKSVWVPFTESITEHREAAIQHIIDNANENQHKQPKWTTLMEEVAELTLALRGKHKDEADIELIQIAGVAINILAQIYSGRYEQINNARTQYNDGTTLPPE